MTATLQDVKGFWERAACGEDLYLPGRGRGDYERQAALRRELEPYIEPFAGFPDTAGREVLELGVGLGADHQGFGEAGARLTGIDLTFRAAAHVRERFRLFGLRSRLLVASAERLPFPDAAFDVVYSWGVLHHTPDTAGAVREAWRVLRPGGEARIMIYHRRSLVGLMLWVRYALLRLRPWVSLSEVYARHLESPGTKAYTRSGARSLMRDFTKVSIRTVLTHGDLLSSEAGQRHRGRLLDLARAIWPRRLIRALFPGCGLFMLIRAVKPPAGEGASR